MSDVFDRITALLREYHLPFELLEHEHVHTSADAAKVRGTLLEEAAKALVLHDRTNNAFFMCIVSGHKKLDLKKIKQVRNATNVSLAHPEDVLKATGCPVGTVPPFPVLFGLDGYCDGGVLENEYVVFSAGSNYVSIRMASKEWSGVAGVVVHDLAQN